MFMSQLDGLSLDAKMFVIISYTEILINVCIMPSFVSCNIFRFKAYFVSCDYGHRALLVTICTEYRFPPFYFQSTCVFASKVSFW